MESHAVASAAAGRPFGALRVIVDPAQRAIPPSVLAALTPDGSIRHLTLLAGLLARPREFVSMLALASDNVSASTGLRTAARAVGEAFGVS
jgi:hypothetical protein